MRSLYPAAVMNGDLFIAYNFYRNLSKQQWIKAPTALQGMTAISLHRTGDIQTAKKIMASLTERAVKDSELGMYWNNPGGYRWYQAPIETHSLLIEAFAEITGDRNAITELKTWLVKNKQTNAWATNSATADAIYAMLLNTGEWTQGINDTKIQLGDKLLPSVNNTPEAGTGYFRERIAGKDVKASMGTIDVFIKTSGNTESNEPAWGAVYWQYFENLANIKASATPLELKKNLFVSENTDRGPKLKPLAGGEFLKTGDKLVVRIELRVDREMEYVYMKDMRASALEPVNIISSHKWQGGLGYYESTKDASTDFFFNHLPKGTYVFEYAMFVTHSGTYQNGITTISSMYAPEFRSNSEAIRINVEAN